LLTALLAGGLRGSAAAETRSPVDRLHELLPSMSVLTDAEMAKFAAGEYEGDAKLYLLPNGRYYYYVWSEAGPNTKFYDTGNWTRHESVIELAADPANIIVKRAGKSFLLLKKPQDHSWIEAFAIELGDQLDRFEAEARALPQRARFAPRARVRQPDAVERLFEMRFSLRRGVGSERMVIWNPVVLDGQNRVAAAIPAFSDRISEFQERAQQYVPKLTAVRSARGTDVAGHYMGNYFGMSSRDLYLLPDGGYYYTEEGDMPSITRAYEKGSWTVRAGVLELAKGVNIEHAPQPVERRFFVMRAPLAADGWSDGSAPLRLILVGTTKEAGNFLSSASEHEGAVLADKKDPKSSSTREALLNDLGTYSSIRFTEPISAKEAVELRTKFEAENLEDAAEWEAEKKPR